MIERYQLGTVQISAVNMATFLNLLSEHTRYNNTGYICVINTRLVYLANKNPEYCKIQNNSLFTVPDGMPLVWASHNLGYKKVGRVSGPDLMNQILKESAQQKYSHYFYGSTPEIISLMKKKLVTEYPDLNIKGLVSPPFQKVEDFDIDNLANELNNLKPTFFWCGLGGPKQEILNYKLQAKLSSTICIGVGLAFDYYAGTVKRPSPFFRKLGLEGIFRDLQQKKRFKIKMIKEVYLYGIWIIISSRVKCLFGI